MRTGRVTDDRSGYSADGWPNSPFSMNAYPAPHNRALDIRHVQNVAGVMNSLGLRANTWVTVCFGCGAASSVRCTRMGSVLMVELMALTHANTTPAVNAVNSSTGIPASWR